MNKRKDSGGYSTLMTSREMLWTFYPEQFPETPEQTDARRTKEWADYYSWLRQYNEKQDIMRAMRTEQENYDAVRAEREKEQRVRRNERLRIADILDRYAPLADPRTIAKYIRSL